jgi:Tol biopolymer transport system component
MEQPIKSRRQNRIRLNMLGAMLISAGAVCGLQAQYFGKNKVSYDKFNFRVIQTEHFRVFYYPTEEKTAEESAEMLERWVERLNRIFDVSIPKHSPVVLYANQADFQQTEVVSGLISQGTGGVTESMQQRIVMPMTGISSENDHVLGHELTHVFQYSMMKNERSNAASNESVPLWFIEGMSEYLSLGRISPLTSMWLRDAVLHKKEMPGFKDLAGNPDYFPYRWGHALWAYLGGTYGDDKIAPLFKAVIDTGWAQGFKKVLHISVDSLSDAWKQTVTATYKNQVSGRTLPENLGKALITGQGKMNLSPEISPDGKTIAYLSQRDVFAIDLYLADTKTGKVIKKLVSTEANPHFDALRFIDASGAWSPDGRQFAFVVFEHGDNAVVFVDVSSGRILKKRLFHSLTDIEQISWSPDGDALMLFGTQGGRGNLFLYDFDTDSLKAVTRDLYAEIHPDWSPDGKTIVFATDRNPDTHPEKQVYGETQIALMTLKTGEIRRISLGSRVRHSCPKFTPDGNSIVFLADADGFSDIYRYRIDEERFERLTRCATGISGLTELSPALSVAKQTGEIAFNIFYNAGYQIHTIDPDTLTPIDSIPPEMDKFKFAALPPEHLEPLQRVPQNMNVAQLGLPDSSTFEITDYKPAIRLLYAGQPVIGIAVDRFGTGVAGGFSLLFGDMLNRDLINLDLQVNGTFKDIGGQLTYLNQRNRIDWGMAAAHIPYRSGLAYSGFDTLTVNSTLLLAQETSILTQRVFSDQLTLMAQYPLSLNRRIEWGLGFDHISYDFELERYFTSLDGYFLDRKKQPVDAPDPLNLFQTYVAYVGDYSESAFTSPTVGMRYRFDVEPTFGSFQYYSVIADFRKYFFFRPVTLAFRALHLGRYGEDAEDTRLTSYFLGYETLVRGYELSNLDPSECTDPGNTGQCPEFSRLTGSRAGIFNAEFRVPFFGVEQYGLIHFRYLPTEISAFVDGGVAWNRHENPVWRLERRSGQRIPVFSTGLALRVNLFGYVVAQVYYAYPFQRPEKGAHFGFVLAPGW